MIQSSLYDGIVERIHDVYASCSFSEQQQLLQILREISITGDSQTLEQLWLTDFKEVPVSINQFLNDDKYLGLTNDHGNSVYPFWRNMLNDVFGSGNKYYEIVLSGATRIGKSSSAVTMLAYMLYRLMLYRDPHKYFHKKAVSKFTLIFANLTKDLAEGVAFHEFQSTLKESPWFNDHGAFNRSVQNPIYLPEGDKIDILPVSDAAHALGMQVWCLVGSTKLLTSEGVKTLEECAGTYQDVMQYDGQFLTPATAPVVCTKYVTETIRIELEDGTIIEGTPEHQVLLSDGTYKALGDLTSSDDLLTFNSSTEVDEMNLKDPNALFDVYIHTSPDNKRYIGITSNPLHVRWGRGGCCYKDNAHFWNAIQKYGWDNFKHEVVASGLSLQEACDTEVSLIAQYDTMNSEHGYNHTTGGNWSTPDDVTRQKLSRALKLRGQDPDYREKISQSLLGHPVSLETRAKISKANTGKNMPESFCAKQRARKHSPETLEKLRGRPSWCKGLTKETDDRVRKIAEKMKGRVVSQEQKDMQSETMKLKYLNGYAPRWITNGIIETSIQSCDELPEGYSYGRLTIRDTYIHRGSDSKKISHSDLDIYLQDGWEVGRPENVGETIRRAVQRMHWEYEGMRFESAHCLAEYLRGHGYPKIVDSTITSLWKKGFNTSPIYSSLQGKIVRIDHENKINPEN